jgi:hypothetical protein
MEWNVVYITSHLMPASAKYWRILDGVQRYIPQLMDTRHLIIDMLQEYQTISNDD